MPTICIDKEESVEIRTSESILIFKLETFKGTKAIRLSVDANSYPGFRSDKKPTMRRNTYWMHTLFHSMINKNDIKRLRKMLDILEDQPKKSPKKKKA